MSTKTDIRAAAASEDLARAVKKLAIKHGIRPNDALKVTGELILRTDAQVRLERRRIEQLPSLADAMANLIATVKAENRRDCDLYLGSLDVDPHTGWLAWGTGQRPYLRRAYSQLCAAMSGRPPHCSQYQLAIPPGRRSVEFGHVRDASKDRSVTLRFRQAPEDETHHIYATVTPQYRKYDPDELAGDLLKVFDGRTEQAKCTVGYRGVYTSVRVFAADEVAATGIQSYALVTSADDGSASVQVSAGVQLPSGAQFACSHGPIARILHRGDPETFRARLQDALGRIDEHVSPWLELWTARSKLDLPDDIETCISALCGAVEETSNPWLTFKDIGPAALTRKLTDTWAQLAVDGATPSQASLAHVFAAAAVNHPWPNEAAIAKLEAAANAILHMTPAQLARLVHPPKRKAEQGRGVDVMNQDVSQGITDRRLKAEQWRARAAAAAEAGDASDAEKAQERAELYDIEGDQIEETGIVD